MAAKSLSLHQRGGEDGTRVARSREFRTLALGFAALGVLRRSLLGQAPGIGRLSRSICSVGLCCLLLGACADTAGEGPENYVVRPQDTLYSIAWRHDLDYRDLARWNNIGGDFHISVGQVLVLGSGRAPSPESRLARAAP